MGSYLVLIFLIPLGLSALVSLRSLPAGSQCPLCAGDTVPLLVRSLRLLRRLTGRPILEVRWCLDCGWEGLTTPHGAAHGTPRGPRATHTSGSVQSSTATSGYRHEAGFTETVDVRSLSIDGRTWRVLLQCWNQTRRCYGRLVFVEPTGRLWTDAGETFTGETRFEVIGQALSATDGVLTSRLRRILSEA
jgi:hypothetical protein